MKVKIRNKELSWLSFNARVLQEAADKTVPLLERLKFLGIFSSNLDEFFRVRVATLKRLENLGKKAAKLIRDNPGEILEKIYKVVLSQQAEFDRVYELILSELEAEKIFIIDESSLSTGQASFVKKFFRDEVRPDLIPIMIDQIEGFPELDDHAIYLAVHMSQKDNPSRTRYALIEVPTHSLSRFVILPKEGESQFIILLDDVIRFSLQNIFSMFNFDQFSAYTIKVNRDSELEFEEDVSESFMRKVAKSLEKRKLGRPVRLIYDSGIPQDLLNFLLERINASDVDCDLIPGARYHNFKDFIRFPEVGSPELRYPAVQATRHPKIGTQTNFLKLIQQQDLLLHFPYQTFDYVIDFLRTAAIDPKVKSIKISLYRLASRSKVVNALINAAMNGKTVTVIMELQARFDEEANLYWSQKLQAAGIKVIHGVSGLKVHAKLILIQRLEKKKMVSYAYVGTGNFHEGTARLYTDHGLFTANKKITREITKVMEFIEHNYKVTAYKHLLVSPFNMRRRLIKLIDTEIANARNGKEAYIILKLNNLTDPEAIGKLYEANEAGVKITLLIRGMFSLVTGVPGMSDKIYAVGIIDRYLEHSRIFIFCNGGDPLYYLSSADWMPRNIDNRVEVACPIFDTTIQAELQHYIDIQLKGNVKTRLLNQKLTNALIPRLGKKIFRAQEEQHKYFVARPSRTSKAPDDSSNGFRDAAAPPALAQGTPSAENIENPSNLIDGP